MAQQPDCIFCQIAQGESPAHRIWEDEHHLAFLSIFPNTEGTTVVVPKAHYGSYIFDQEDEVICQLMLATKKTAAILDNYFQDVSRTGVIFEGFGVDHLHAKLYPMHGTGRLNEWEQIESEQVKTYYEKYPGYLISNDSHRADDEKLAALAKKLRDSV